MAIANTLVGVTLLAILSTANAACGDCSLNGVCDEKTSLCICDPQWEGEDCRYLKFAPAPSSVSFHGINDNASSWGGSVLHIKDKYVMFAAEMTNKCTLRHWTTNSEVVIAVADKPTGPYKEQFQVIPPWAHNPEAILTSDGTIVIYTLGWGLPVHGPPVNCAGAPSPPPPRPPTPPPAPPGTFHDVHFLIRHAPADKYDDPSAWQAFNTSIVDFPAEFKFPGNWNPAPVALPDGRVRIMVHTGWSGTGSGTTLGWSGEVIVEAPTWKGPYRMISSKDITNCTKCEEDPFMWMDKRKNWHVIYHRMFDNSTGPSPSPSPEGDWSGGHSYSADGLHWSPITRCYNTTVQLVDGTHVTFNSRERPKLIVGPDGVPTHLSNAVQPFQTAGPDAGVTHTLVVPLAMD